MKTEDFEKTTKELQKEIEDNNEQILVDDEKMRMAKVNQFDYKLVTTFVLSAIPYLVLIIVEAILCKTGAMTTLANILPIHSIPLTLTGISIGAGALGTFLLKRIYKTQSRFKAFNVSTDVKTEVDKLEQEVKYSIEVEKNKNQNVALKQTIELLKSNQSVLDSLSEKYEIIDKNSMQTKLETEEKVRDLESLLKDKNHLLENLSVKKVLHEKFWRLRAKGQKGLDLCIAGGIGAILATIYCMFPNILIIVSEIPAASTLTTSFKTILTTLILGAGLNVGYMVKKNRDYEQVFQRLNDELGADALPDNIIDAALEEKTIRDQQDSLIKEISVARSELEEQRRIDESFDEDLTVEETESLSLNPDLSATQSITNNLQIDRPLSLQRKQKLNNDHKSC